MKSENLFCSPAPPHKEINVCELQNTKPSQSPWFWAAEVDNLDPSQAYHLIDEGERCPGEFWGWPSGRSGFLDTPSTPPQLPKIELPDDQFYLILSGNGS